MLLRHRDGLPRRIGADPAGREISHRILCRAVVRRHGRRPVRRARCALHLLLDRRISDPGCACRAVPAARERAAGGHRQMVLAGAGRTRRRACCAVHHHGRALDLVRGSPRLGGRRRRRARRAAGAGGQRPPLEDLRHRRARAGVDPCLSGGRRPRHHGAQLLRRAQDRGDARRLFPRADARHHDPRCRALPQQ